MQKFMKISNNKNDEPKKHTSNSPEIKNVERDDASEKQEIVLLPVMTAQTILKNQKQRFTNLLSENVSNY